ncbi:type II toxin-antitoxin system PemK/MazF family toxin [Paracoccus sp. MC1862]|uniref:type II toxin-antitoxin system PemK/MazF family toxin n=1 Tax=Paracoccus sp. MC1862 TaxID=2760307 RepID=UPI001600ED49|nr:type II toxin-antitoxin system PemK/MazF family toxin [Paracoccus sp. MC1862]QQO46728.1 type II toxin-antitoxin system PemK/MazF family toxin [Paracoccus sp. MC1862]
MIQADQFAEAASVTVLPVTSTLTDAPLLRLTVVPTPENGLRAPSQVMIDKPVAIRRERIGPVFGHLDDEAMMAVNRLLVLFFGMAG